MNIIIYLIMIVCDMKFHFSLKQQWMQLAIIDNPGKLKKPKIIMTFLKINIKCFILYMVGFLLKKMYNR